MQNVLGKWARRRPDPFSRHFNISCLVDYSYQDPYLKVIPFSTELPSLSYSERTTEWTALHFIFIFPHHTEFLVPCLGTIKKRDMHI
jgi:hypothetical protein